MTTAIKQLGADQVARHAFTVFLFSGRHQTGARLIYHALKLDPLNAQAIRYLSDLMDSDGTEVFSAIVLEHALSKPDYLSGEDRKILDDLLFLAKWSWGFSIHESGAANLSQEAFSDRAAFDVDYNRYSAFLKQITDQTGSLSGGFNAAHTLCGTMAGFLKHHELGGNAGVSECLHPERFRLTSAYDDWLETTTEELDRLERERCNQAASNAAGSDSDLC